ncbi:MAG: hypothetical protein MUD01_27420, partial [Chloroflexaceae bacterium]|nr:hypothetical protein [Chloroflexaceae bacterium]
MANANRQRKPAIPACTIRPATHAPGSLPHPFNQQQWVGNRPPRAKPLRQQPQRQETAHQRQDQG